MSAGIAVVITCYGYARYLPDCVESVLAQELPPDEIVIVDDGSPDDSYAVACGLRDAHPRKRIAVVTQKNSGTAAAARNRGARETDAEFIMFLDADDTIEPAYLAATHAALAADATAGFAYTDRHDFGDIDKDVPSLPYDLRSLSRACYVNCCALMRRAAFDRVGGYKTNVNGMEDWDLWLSLGEAGYRGVHVPRTLFRYRRHGAGLFADAQKKKDLRIAQIIANHPALYPADDVRAAGLVLRQARLLELQERLRALEAGAKDGI